MKGKDAEDCENYIKALHTTQDGKFLVCGTNAFDPICDHMVSTNGTLILEGSHQRGRGSVPFDPHQMQTSLMVGKYRSVLHVLMPSLRSGPARLCLSSYRHLLFMVESKQQIAIGSEDGDDDNVFLFFTEKAAEQLSGNIRVSRIARVCKGDMGGRRTLQMKWTTYLKARLDCPLAHSGMPSLVQDVFLLEDPDNWRDSIFYGTFTSEPETSGTWGQSAVCAYKLSDVTEAFRGRFLTRLHSGRWDIYTGEVPVPRPGSCINNKIRATGVTSSLDLPDQSLLFVKEHPLMESAVRPVSGKPLLVQAGTHFSKIIVERVPSLDGAQHHVMFIGTDSGWLQKAVWFSGEGSHIIEELQLFQTPQPVSFLQLSSTTGQLYTGSRDVVVQIDTSECSSYTSCYDCVLARDPYCGWDQVTLQCAPAAGASSRIQSLNDGDVSMCPPSEVKTKPVVIHLDIGTSELIPCSPEVNLPVSWKFPDTVVLPSDRHMVINNDLLITRATKSDAGLYNCETVETVKGNKHYQTVVQYLLLVQDTNSADPLQTAAIVFSFVANLVNIALYITIVVAETIPNCSCSSSCAIIRCVATTDEDHRDALENDHHNDYDHRDNYVVILIPEDVVDHQGYNNNHDNYEVNEIPEEELEHQGCGDH
uniref:Sema domain-containing protein n=1 Tax=Myripristis murdjan TaxID=586833 RepID=A0A667XH87_9TELE